MPTTNQELDEFEQKLDNSVIELKSCQQKNSISSCTECKELIGCELRNNYVEAVYQSMNKNQTGGFEFN